MSHDDGERDPLDALLELDGEEELLLTSEDLTDEQRAWAPANLREAMQQWPFSWRCEAYDGALQFSGEPPEGEGWDWRSVAAAVRAYPGARVELRNPGWLSVYLPEA
ncbi:hypothetical protein [Kineococcus glutinatus]|uniref:Uncharacterized protein n=1 Tax=Kineococcus glutinatus TaxID=1070872 RepID=A0ABP9HIY1_9ACTN